VIPNDCYREPGVFKLVKTYSAPRYSNVPTNTWSGPPLAQNTLANDALTLFLSSITEWGKPILYIIQLQLASLNRNYATNVTLRSNFFAICLSYLIIMTSACKSYNVFIRIYSVAPGKSVMAHRLKTTVLSQLVLRFIHSRLFALSALVSAFQRFTCYSIACRFKDWRCVVLREIDVLLKIYRKVPHLSHMWR